MPELDRPVRCLHCGKNKANSRRGLCVRCYSDRAVRAGYPLPAEPPKPKVCRHCSQSKVNRPRGLCWPCYYTPGVKDRYAPTSKYARRGVGHGHISHAPLPAEPTDAEPGSEEKIRVLAERAARGERLHHPDDARVEARSAGPTAPTPGTLHRMGARWLSSGSLESVSEDAA